jgi:hypothetical protein|tara:strand:- start:12802 stop:12987 length:186 start_codon:yes stop_codon:yes gene_type:complete
MKSNKNNLLDYFARDHDQLSKEYLEDCEKFLINLGNKRNKFKGGNNRSNLFISALKKGGRI